LPSGPQEEKDDDAIKVKVDKNIADINEIQQKLDKIGKDFTLLSTSTKGVANQIDSKIEGKADIESIKDLESMLDNIVKLYKDIDKISNVLNKRFADKGDVSNQFKIVSRRIKEIKKQMAGNTSNTSDTEEAVLTKRVMGQYCASCDKEMVNMRADSVGYATWEKFPLRDQSMRMKGNLRSPARKTLEKEGEEVKVQDNSLPQLYSKH
jgi:hypothetical protein